MRARHGVSLLVVALASATVAPAQTVLVSNLAEPTRSTTIVTQGLWAAQAFATDGTGYTLFSIETLLGLRTLSPTIVAELRADGGAAGVGATLGTFGFGPVSTGAPSVVTLVPTSTIALAPSTTYWLVLGVSGQGSVGWSYAEGNAYTGPGSIGAYAYSNDAGATWPSGLVGTDNPYQIAVNVTPEQTVPEPRALSLMALGAAALGVARRTRRARV